MRVVVTGGSGQLGSLVIEEISAQHEVVSVDLLPPQTQGHLHLQLDIRDPEGMSRACKGADALVHTAAQVSVLRSTEDPRLDMDVNLRGTLTVLDAALREGLALFIYISTAAVYGDPVTLPVGEGHPTFPKSFYGASKLSGEHYVRAYREVLGLDHIIVRPFNMYSPRADPTSPYSGVITRFVEGARAGKTLRVDGDGSQTRDFIHARDVARMISTCLDSRVRNVTMNCASGKGTSINQLVEAVTMASPQEVRVEHASPRRGDIRHSVGDPSLAQRLLGYSTSITLEEGIRGFF